MQILWTVQLEFELKLSLQHYTALVYSRSFLRLSDAQSTSQNSKSKFTKDNIACIHSQGLYPNDNDYITCI